MGPDHPLHWHRLHYHVIIPQAAVPSSVPFLVSAFLILLKQKSYKDSGPRLAMAVIVDSYKIE